MNKDVKMHNIIIKFVRIIDLLLVSGLFAVCWIKYYGQEVFYLKGHFLIICFYLVLYYFFAKLYDGFDYKYSKVSELVYSQTLGFLISDAILYIVICLLSRKIVSVVPGIGCVLCQFIVTVFWSWSTNKCFFSTYAPKKSVVISKSDVNFQRIIDENGLNNKFKVYSTYKVVECLDNLELLKEYESVFLYDVCSHERNIIMKYCVSNAISVYILPRVGDMILSGAKSMHMFRLPILRVRKYNPPLEYVFFKRLFDIIVSVIGLIILSPIIAVTAIAIKANDNGPVFYKQRRYTKDSKEFYILKFRSMRVDAEKDGAQLSSGENDDRITPVGRIIRKLRIDELPQLWNVLVGDMSIVGPRPERPEISEVYEQDLPEFNLRLQTKAGLTGYAQVYGKYNTAPYDKLLMDLMYIANPSVIEDLKIIFATIKILFLPESTEGVAEGQKTALNRDKTNV